MSAERANELISKLSFNEQGLIPAIVQEASDGEVLMLAWMNAEALRRTLTETRVTFWSRSRQEFWRKGDTSGNIQTVVSAHADCDGDVVLLKVHQHGAACHTGLRSCFDSLDLEAVAGQ